MKDHKVKCVCCGRFISFDALRAGEANSKFTPDTQFTTEKMEFICEDCKDG